MYQRDVIAIETLQHQIDDVQMKRAWFSGIVAFTIASDSVRWGVLRWSGDFPDPGSPIAIRMIREGYWVAVVIDHFSRRAMGFAVFKKYRFPARPPSWNAPCIKPKRRPST